MSDNESAVVPAGGGANKAWTAEEKMRICLQALKQLATVDGQDTKLPVNTKDIRIDDRSHEDIKKVWAAIVKDARRYDTVDAQPAAPRSRTTTKKDKKTTKPVEATEEKSAKKAAKAATNGTNGKQVNAAKKKLKVPEPASESEEESSDDDTSNIKSAAGRSSRPEKKGKITKEIKTEAGPEESSKDNSVPAPTSPQLPPSKKRKRNTDTSTTNTGRSSDDKEASGSVKEDEVGAETQEENLAEENAHSSDSGGVAKKSIFGPAK